MNLSISEMTFGLNGGTFFSVCSLLASVKCTVSLAKCNRYDCTILSALTNFILQVAAICGWTCNDIA